MRPRDTLSRAASIASPGPVLQKQMSTLKDWIARADVPVAIALQSDNLTQVTIYRVGSWAHSPSVEIELVPGSYTLVGTRPGYRDVRREINVPRRCAGAGRDPLRGSHLSGLVVRESLGERRCGHRLSDRRRRQRQRDRDGRPPAGPKRISACTKTSCSCSPRTAPKSCTTACACNARRGCAAATS